LTLDLLRLLAPSCRENLSKASSNLRRGHRKNACRDRRRDHALRVRGGGRRHSSASSPAGSCILRPGAITAALNLTSVSTVITMLVRCPENGIGREGSCTR